MRIIKFRAWDEDAKKMESPRYIENITGRPADWKRGGGSLAISYHHIIMQFVGLHDKNGKEIYEGDIYSEDHGPDGASIGTIDNINGDIVLRFFPGTRPEGWNNEYYPVYGKLDDGEVIGNIYENGDLLKED